MATADWSGARIAESCESNGAAGGIGAAVVAAADDGGRVAAAAAAVGGDAAAREWRIGARMTATAMKASVDASANCWPQCRSDVAETDTDRNFAADTVPGFSGRC